MKKKLTPDQNQVFTMNRQQTIHDETRLRLGDFSKSTKLVLAFSPFHQKAISSQNSKSRNPFFALRFEY